MQEKHLYEYAVIRFVPKVEREEFINIGIIMFSKGARYLRSKSKVNKNKISLFATEVEIDCLKQGLEAFEIVCNSSKKIDTMSKMDIAEKFRWLTAVRSTCIQTSRPHAGFTSDLDATLESLFRELVM